MESAVDGPGWRLRFAEVTDRTAADRFRGAYLEAVVAPGEELPRGEYYWHEIIGCAVRDVGGADLGSVVDVYRAGGVDAWVVRSETYGEYDIPAVRDFVRILAPRRGEIVVDADALGLVPVRTRRAHPVTAPPEANAPEGTPASPEETPANPEGTTGGPESSS